MPSEAEVRMILRVVFLVQRLREAVSTLEDAGRIARRVLGGAHPLTMDMGGELQDARDALYARGLP